MNAINSNQPMASNANKLAATQIRSAGISKFLKESALAITTDSPLNRFFGLPDNDPDNDPNELTNELSQSLNALASPTGQLGLRVLLANQVVHTEFFACQAADRGHKFISITETGKNCVLSQPLSVSELLDVVADALGPSLAAPTENLQWELSLDGTATFIAVVDCARSALFESILNRHPITGFKILLNELQTQIEAGNERPDARWLQTIVNENLPLFAQLDRPQLKSGMLELCECGLLQPSNSDENCYYPTEAIFEITRSLLLPLPAVGLRSIDFERDQTALNKTLLRGNSIWRIDAVGNEPKTQIAILDSATCLVEVATQLGQLILGIDYNNQSEACIKCAAPTQPADKFCRRCGADIVH